MHRPLPKSTSFFLWNEGEIYYIKRTGIGPVHPSLGGENSKGIEEWKSAHPYYNGLMGSPRNKLWAR